MEPITQCTNVAFAKSIDPKRKIATDITGKFTITSNRGNKYLSMIYNYKIILVLTMKGRIDNECIRVFKDLCERLLPRDIKTVYMRLDN